MTSDRRTLPYDPALDGLRAMAVIAVMVYHGFLGWLDGGYLGVDLFFVLSGYLITTLLIIERVSTGGISLGEFWYRRARRLLPTLFVVLAAVAVYAAAAEPSRAAGLRRDGIATLAYSANWRLVASGQSYFDQFSEPSPLRHMWSLAIEEQWYLVWPLVIAWGLRRRKWHWKGWPIALVGAATVSAIAMSVLAVGRADTSRAYYGTDTRVHALLVGAALAFVLHRWRDESGRLKSGHPLASLAGVIGLGGLVVMFVTAGDTDRWMYHGGFLLAAVLSGALVVGATVDSPSNPLRSVLAVPPLPLIGRLSYALYLWHWPVYVWLTPSRTGIDGPALLALRVLVSTAAAGVSYVLVERRLRSLRIEWHRLAAGATGFAGAIAIAFVVGTAGAEQADNVVVGTVEVADDVPRAFIVGDSVFLDLLVHYEPWRYTQLNVRSGTVLGCGVVDPDPDIVSEQCRDRFAVWRSRVEGFDPDTIVVPLSTWDLRTTSRDGEPVEFGSEAFAEIVRSSLDEIRAAFGATDDDGPTTSLVLLPCTTPNENQRNARGLDVGETVERTRWLNGVVSEYADTLDPERVSVIDLGGYVCNDAMTEATIDGAPAYRDGIHFRSTLVPLVWDFLTPRIVEAAGAANPRSAIVGPAEVLVVGDSIAFEFGRDAPLLAATDEAVLVNGGYLGCGVFAGQYRAENLLAEGTDFDCEETRDRWARRVASVDPDVVMIMLGGYELFDWELDGVIYAVGTPEHADYVEEQLDAATEVLSAQGAAVVVLTVPCMNPSSDGLGPVRGAERADAQRRDTVNRLLRDHAAAHADEITLIDLGDHLCPTGRYEPERNGVAVHSDGVHYTPETAAAVWEWLIPQLPSERTG